MQYVSHRYPLGDFLKQPTKVLSMAAALCLFSSVAVAQNQGTTLFQSHCEMCHGADGTGTPTGKALKVVDLHDPAVMKASDADLATIIRKGKNMMPAFGDRLTSPQIDSLVSYIRELQKKK